MSSVCLAAWVFFAARPQMKVVEIPRLSLHEALNRAPVWRWSAAGFRAEWSSIGQEQAMNWIADCRLLASGDIVLALPDMNQVIVFYRDRRPAKVLGPRQTKSDQWPLRGPAFLTTLEDQFWVTPLNPQEGDAYGFTNTGDFVGVDHLPAVPHVVRLPKGGYGALNAAGTGLAFFDQRRRLLHDMNLQGLRGRETPPTPPRERLIGVRGGVLWLHWDQGFLAEISLDGRILWLLDAGNQLSPVPVRWERRAFPWRLADTLLDACGHEDQTLLLFRKENQAWVALFDGAKDILWQAPCPMPSADRLSGNGQEIVFCASNLGHLECYAWPEPL